MGVHFFLTGFVQLSPRQFDGFTGAVQEGEGVHVHLYEFCLDFTALGISPFFHRGVRNLLPRIGFGGGLLFGGQVVLGFCGLEAFGSDISFQGFFGIPEYPAEIQGFQQDIQGFFGIPEYPAEILGFQLRVSESAIHLGSCSISYDGPWQGAYSVQGLSNFLWKGAFFVAICGVDQNNLAYASVIF